MRAVHAEETTIVVVFTEEQPRESFLLFVRGGTFCIGMLDLSQATDQSFNDEKPRMMMRIVSLFLVFFIATADIIADPGGDLSCLIACCEEDCSGLDTS
jgi:hypothetical protein